MTLIGLNPINSPLLQIFCSTNTFGCLVNLLV
nr:MAG TPA: hypothetical protein [Inoviridae sp.]